MLARYAMMSQPNEVVKHIEKEFYITGLFTPESVLYKDYLFLDDRVAVVVGDVLRCSTTILALLASGARGVVLRAKPFDAEPNHIDIGLHERLFPGVDYVVGGEQHGRPMVGALFGNSPRDIKVGLVSGKLVYYFSTNLGGLYSELVRLVSKAGKRWRGDILLGSLCNVEALVQLIKSRNYAKVVIVGAGFYNTPSLEDVVWCGEIVKRLGVPTDLLEDNAQIASIVADKIAVSERAQAFQKNRIGRALTKYEMGADIPATLSGVGLAPEIYRRMGTTVGIVQWFEDLPVIVPFLPTGITNIADISGPNVIGRIGE